jgi:hypothetical protein
MVIMSDDLDPEFLSEFIKTLQEFIALEPWNYGLWNASLRGQIDQKYFELCKASEALEFPPPPDEWTFAGRVWFYKIQGRLHRWAKKSVASHPDLPPKGAKVDSADVRADFRDGEKTDGAVLTTSYLADHKDWKLFGPLLRDYYKRGVLTRHIRVKVGKHKTQNVYLYRELLNVKRLKELNEIKVGRPEGQEKRASAKEQNRVEAEKETIFKEKLTALRKQE